MTTPSFDLRHGLWEDVLADVECDLWLGDAPYGERTHRGHNLGSKQRDKLLCSSSRELDYDFLRPSDVRRIVRHWSERTRGWFVTLTSDDLIPHWQGALRKAGRYVFATLPVLEFYRPRLLGDGPGARVVHMIAARPRSREFIGRKWGSLPGDYRGELLPADLLPQPFYERSEGEPRPGRMGGKCLSVMRAIIRDYSRPGEVVCDPFAGWATTLLAAVMEGRQAIGAEQDRQAFESGLQRLKNRFDTGPLFEQLEISA